MKTLLATLLLIAGWISGAAAASLAEVQVIDRTTGQTLETWRHRGRLYVAGTPGNRYAVNLRNGTGAVISQGPGTPSVGLKIDHRHRLFVAGRSAVASASPSWSSRSSSRG